MGIEAFNQLGEEERDIFAVLMRRVDVEARVGGPRTVYSILDAIKSMTTEELEACIALYNNDQTVVAAAEKQLSLPLPGSGGEAQQLSDVASRAWSQDAGWHGGRWDPWQRWRQSHAWPDARSQGGGGWREWTGRSGTSWGWKAENAGWKDTANDITTTSSSRWLQNGRDHAEEVVLNEVRAQIRASGKAMFLSTVGAGLSQKSHHYLKLQKVGVKKFLERHQAEFGIEGSQGQEMVRWHPDAEHVAVGSSPTPST